MRRRSGDRCVRNEASRGDTEKRVARAQADSLVGDLDEAIQRFGLATPVGTCPTVGIAGLTLGGGEGVLMPKYGATCDNLVSAYPKNKWVKWGAYALATGVSLSRYPAKKHYPSDILIGATLGYITGTYLAGH